MKIKKILIILLITLSIILTGIDVNAAEAKISATKNNAQVGDAVTIDVSFTAAAWNLTVSGDKISGESYASQTSDLSEQTTNKSFKLDTSKAGEYTVRISGDITDENGKTTKVNESVTIKVSEPVKKPEQTTPKEPENNTGSGNNVTPSEPTTPAEPTKSSDATLKMLGLGASSKNPSQYDFSGFKSSKTSYDVTVPYEVKSLEVYYTVNNGKAKATVSGNESLEIGKNAIKVTVTAEDGKQKTYTINVTREEEKILSGDATLSNLGIGKSASEPSEYDFTGFTKSKYEYSVEVPYEVTSLDIYYKVSKSTSIADVSGSSDFNVGENEINILVTAEDGTQKTYTINVTRLAEKTVEPEPEGNKPNEENPTQQPQENGLQLEKLEISKGKLSPAFAGSVTDYSVTVGSSVEKLDITATANDENATIEIAGNEGLKEGKNIVTILVRSADDSEIVTYQINVTKKSGFDIAGFFENRENQNIMLILGGILILIIIIIIILVKDAREDNEEEDVKVKHKKSKAKRFKDDSKSEEVINEMETSDETDSVNK